MTQCVKSSVPLLQEVIVCLHHSNNLRVVHCQVEYLPCLSYLRLSQHQADIHMHQSALQHKPCEEYCSRSLGNKNSELDVRKYLTKHSLLTSLKELYFLVMELCQGFFQHKLHQALIAIRGGGGGGGGV